MKKHARLVVVGSGIAGIATCYHLAKMGWSDMSGIGSRAIVQGGQPVMRQEGCFIQPRSLT